MDILVTNDDGIDAAGLDALANALADLGRVFVVAPRQQMSGTSHSITTESPLRVEACGEDRYSVDGTPADCARIGLMTICPQASWVMSGINFGANLGVDVWMSGTVAAAREATLLGRQAIAWSQYFRNPDHANWSDVAAAAVELFAELQLQPASEGHFYNVNFADPADLADSRQWSLAPLDSHPLPVSYQQDPQGAWQYRCDYHQRLRAAGSDVEVCFGGCTTVTEMAAG